MKEIILEGVICAVAAGLLLSAVVNLCLGFTNSFVLFIALWAVNGWAQSMGAAPCVVALSRWFSDKDRGSVYGFWSNSTTLELQLLEMVIAVSCVCV